MKRIAYVLSLLVTLCVGTLAHAQLTLTGAGRGAPSGGGGGGCSQATTLNGALDGSQNNAAITTLICGMVTDGTYSKLLGLYVPVTNSLANFYVNWAGPGTFNLTPHNAGNCTFTANTGLQGDGSTCYFDTGFTPSTGGGSVYTSTSESAGVCVSAAGNSQPIVSSTDSAGSTYTYISPGATVGYDLNGATFNATAGAGTTGGFIETRTTDTVRLYYNGTSLGDQPDTHRSLQDQAWPLWARVVPGAAINNYSSDTGLYVLFGAYLTPTDVANIRSRLNTYLTTVRGSSPC